MALNRLKKCRRNTFNIPPLQGAAVNKPGTRVFYEGDFGGGFAGSCGRNAGLLANNARVVGGDLGRAGGL
jgi:hypothetical protein